MVMVGSVARGAKNSVLNLKLYNNGDKCNDGGY